MASLTRRVTVLILAAVVFGLFVVAPAQGAVNRSEREVVVFIAPLDSPGISALDRGLYDSIELAAYGGAVGILSPAYGRVTTVQGASATLAGLRNALRTATNRPGVRAVDLIFVTHGATSRVVFSDGDRSMSTVRDDIVNNLTATQRGRLRVVFSTACFGATHRASWIAAGFDAASGAVGIYADSAVSYVPFLTAWALGQSFNSAVSVANAIDPFRVFDNLAKAYYNSKNKAALANQINSSRITSGATGITVDGNPVGTFRLAPARATVVVGQRVTYDFSWTVPKPRTWQRLRSMGLRLKDDQSTAIALRWSQASNRFQLVDGNDRPISVSKRAGQGGSLAGPLATLSLRRTRFVGKGRTATLTLPLTFSSPLAVGRTFRVQVRADEDGGAEAPWQDAGTLSVR